MNPCKDCNARSPICHAECEKYKAFADEVAAEREKHNKQKQIQHMLYETDKKKRRR